jgi:hypothetical protein
MKSVGARIGKLANRLFQRSGKVLDGRYHLRPLRRSRYAHCVTLLNHRHHNRAAASTQTLDRSPSPQPDPARPPPVDGWRTTTAPPNPADVREVAPARTWLLQTGWRRHGLIHPADVP